MFAHLEGVNHVYVDKPADPDMAKSIVLNAKMRRTGVCGAAETLLVDRAAAATQSEAAGRACCSMPAAKCAAMPPCRRPIARVKPATDEDWDTEYLDAIIAAARGRRRR